MGGRRGDGRSAQAVQDQLGFTVLDLKPVGLAGSGGSTPLRLQRRGRPRHLPVREALRDEPRARRPLVQARPHDPVRAAGGRGAVPVGAPARRVRGLRAAALRDSGIPTAAPYGIVEITPEREYLLVTEFFDGAQEIGDADVDDDFIDEGLAIIRQLWDAGLAHRDIKPANLLVRDGQVLLIDVAFVQVRPSPWRQAVDLANMMLVLAVRTDAERVYARALRYFTPDEIAEAFAAARGVASPTQLRTVDEAGRARPARPVPRAGAARDGRSRCNAGARGGSSSRVLVVVGVAARRARRCWACSPRPTTWRRGKPHVRHRRRDGPHGAVGAVGDVGAVPRHAPGRLEARWRRRSTTERARFWLDSDSPGDRARSR